MHSFMYLFIYFKRHLFNIFPGSGNGVKGQGQYRLSAVNVTPVQLLL